MGGRGSAWRQDKKQRNQGGCLSVCVCVCLCVSVCVRVNHFIIGSFGFFLIQTEIR